MIQAKRRGLRDGGDLRALAALCMAAAMVSGCGGGGGAGTPPPPPPPPPPVTVSALSPADGSTEVDVQDTLQVTFSGDVQSSMLTADHVALWARGARMPARLAYDAASRTLTIDPMEMAYGGTYDLEVSGVLDAQGRAVPDVSVHFATDVNPQTSDQTYLLRNPVTGAVVTYQAATFDVDDHHLASETYALPGPDGVWGTADDFPAPSDALSVWTYNALGESTSWTMFNQPGPDGLWGTADDTIAASSTTTYDDAGRQLTVLTRVGSTFSNAEHYAYDPAGWESTAQSVYDLGPDGLLGTADDAIDDWTTLVRDADGLVVASYDYTSPGPDGVWGSAGSTATSVTEFVHDASGRLIRIAQHIGPGPDGQWLTGDDLVDNLTEIHRDARGNAVWIGQMQPGADGIAGTADDVLISYTVIEVDGNDRRVRQTTYYAPGPDGVMGTADDFSSEDATFDASR